MQILTCNELDIFFQSLPLGVITANYLLPSYLVPGILLVHTSPLLNGPMQLSCLFLFLFCILKTTYNKNLFLCVILLNLCFFEF